MFSLSSATNDQPLNVYPSRATGSATPAFFITSYISSLSFILKLSGPSYVPFAASLFTVIVYSVLSTSSFGFSLYVAVSIMSPIMIESPV